METYDNALMHFLIATEVGKFPPKRTEEEEESALAGSL